MSRPNNNASSNDDSKEYIKECMAEAFEQNNVTTFNVNGENFHLFEVDCGSVNIAKEDNGKNNVDPLKRFIIIIIIAIIMTIVRMLLLLFSL